MQDCLVCQLNRTKNCCVYEDEYWQVDLPVDIDLEGLFFIKPKRHIESLGEMKTEEATSLGPLLSQFTQLSKEISSANKVISLNLGLKVPHLHFWIVPVTKHSKPYISSISSAVKNLADAYRDSFR